MVAVAELSIGVVFVASFALVVMDDAAELPFCEFLGAAAAPVPLVVRRSSRSSVVAGIVGSEVLGMLKLVKGIRNVVEEVVVSTTAIRVRRARREG